MICELLNYKTMLLVIFVSTERGVNMPITIDYYACNYQTGSVRNSHGLLSSARLAIRALTACLLFSTLSGEKKWDIDACRPLSLPPAAVTCVCANDSSGRLSTGAAICLGIP